MQHSIDHYLLLSGRGAKMRTLLVSLFIAVRMKTMTTWAMQFNVALWGDLPYIGRTANVFSDGQFRRGIDYGPLYRGLRDSINSNSEVAFALHTGDIKASGQACTDYYYTRFSDLSNSLNVPSLLTLGDNGWTDCHRADPPSNPLSALATLRSRFFGAAGLPMETGAPNYPENQMFVYDDVLFILVHVTGSNNNLYDSISASCPSNLNDWYDRGCVDATSEFTARNTAVNTFLSRAFDKAIAEDRKGVMVVIQADMFLRGTDRKYDKWDVKTGHRDFYDTLLTKSDAYRRPVALVHGDSHYFRIFNPTYFNNFVDVMVPGSSYVGWVNAKIDSASAQVFLNFDLIDDFDTNIDPPTNRPTYSPTDSPTGDTETEWPEIEVQVCFSPKTSATVEGKGSIPMKDIVVGDRVLTMSGQYQTIYTISHYHSSKPTNFIKIVTSSSDSLELTQMHMVFTHGQVYPIVAKDVKIGDYLETVNGPEEVLHILKVTRNGMYNPLTTDGTIVAGGIFASVYTSFTGTENIEVSGHAIISIQNFLDKTIFPYLTICMSLELCNWHGEGDLAFIHRNMNRFYRDFWSRQVSWIQFLIFVLYTFFCGVTSLCLQYPVISLTAVFTWLGVAHRIQQLVTIKTLLRYQ